MSVLAWVAAALLAAAVAARATGLLALARTGGVIRVSLRQGPGAPRSAQVDLSEGLVSHGLLCALALLTADMVASSNWVLGKGGTDVLRPLAIYAAIFSIVLAKACRRSTTYWLALEAGAIAALFLGTAPRGLGLVDDFVVWVQEVSRSLDLAVLVCLCGATWLSTGWAAFFVIRRRNVALGLAPLALVIGVEVINDSGQPGLTARVLLWMVLAALLALRLNLSRLTARWRNGRNEQVAWSVSVEGARALIILVAVAFLLPRLTSVDISGRLFKATGHPPPSVGPGPGPGPEGSDQFRQTGYTEKVVPGGTLVRSATPVLEVAEDSSRTVYWRGIALYDQVGGAWTPGDPAALRAGLASNQLFQDDNLSSRLTIQGRVRVLGGTRDSMFFPGEPLRVDVPTQVRGLARTGGSTSALRFDTVDAVYGAGRTDGPARYNPVATISVATDTQLRAAGTSYPPAVRELGKLNDIAAGLPSTVPADVAALARQVSAAATNNYDRAKAIETYLRGLHYRLDVAAPPGDPVEYFLFTSKTGYCEYFASSMGEMVRSLGIPVRLVNGYGPGALDEKSQKTIIKASDAHTWVEVYFPGFGWVPFEPTPDPNYPAFDRSAAAQVINPPGSIVPRVPSVGGARVPAGQPHPAGGAALPFSPLPILLLVALAAAAAIGVRVLKGGPRVSDVAAPWRRLHWLARRVGVGTRPSDTPLEFARRLAAALPAIGPEVVRLADGYSRACFSRAGLSADEREHLEAAWGEVRSGLVRLLVLGRPRPRSGPLSDLSAAP